MPCVFYTHQRTVRTSKMDVSLYPVNEMESFGLGFPFGHVRVSRPSFMAARAIQHVHVSVCTIFVFMCAFFVGFVLTAKSILCV